MLIIIKATN